VIQLKEDIFRSSLLRKKKFVPCVNPYIENRFPNGRRKKAMKVNDALVDGSDNSGEKTSKEYEANATRTIVKV